MNHKKLSILAKFSGNDWTNSFSRATKTYRLAKVKPVKKKKRR
jgi:hypothetical protein